MEKYMGTYTNASVYKKTDSNNHDCANDGTCGQSIRDFRIDDSNISFHDGDGKTIAQIPNLPHLSSQTYSNNLYKSAESASLCMKNISIQGVLPNQFNFEYEKLNCVIHYDNVSQREQNQIKLDIQNAYEAYKAKFCINSDTQVTVHTYIFNNQFDYMKYNTLVFKDLSHQSLPDTPYAVIDGKTVSLDFSYGQTNGKIISLYKDADMDHALAHEFGHVFQFKLSTTEVKQLDNVNNQLMANAIGLEVKEKNYEVKEKNYKAFRELIDIDTYEDVRYGCGDSGERFNFTYKGTTCSIYRHHELSEEEKIQIIKNVKNYCGLVDKYEDIGGRVYFTYKGTTCSIYRHDLSEEEKLQIVENIRNVCGLIDTYEDLEGAFYFKYKGTYCSISRENLSEEEKVQIIQRVMNLCERTDVDEYREYEQVFQIKYKGTTCSIRRENLSEEEKVQVIQNFKKNVCGLVDEYADHGLVDEYPDSTGAWRSHQFVDRDGWLFEFEYKGVFYLVQHKNLSEEEKFQIIQDIRSSYKSLVSECDRLGKKYTSLVVIEVDEDKDIDIIHCYDINKGTHNKLDKTLISRSKPEQEVDESSEDHTSPEPEKEEQSKVISRSKSEEDEDKIDHTSPEPEKEEQSKVISRSKPEQEVDEVDNESPKPEKGPEVTINKDAGSEKEEQSKVISGSKPEEEVDKIDHASPEPKEELEVTINEDAGPEQEENSTFSVIKFITGSISSFFSWLSWSKEEEFNQQSDNNLSSLELNVNDNVAENFVNNHHLSDDYHPTDEFM